MGAMTGTEELWDQFCHQKVRKQAEGCVEYGRKPGEPFVGDAAAEASAEAVDLSNYVDQLATERRITVEEQDRWTDLMFEAFVWADRVKNDVG